MASQTGGEQKKGSGIQYLLTILTVAGTIAAASIPILLNTYSSKFPTSLMLILLLHQI